ncbi:MAG: hypothetical protein GY757_26815, partial [bacterium]|nr:hypothetical protein [bacterium]
IENKLLLFLGQGITEVDQLETEISKMQKAAPTIDKKIFDLIDFDVVSEGTVQKNVKFLDFYRYCDVTNEDMIGYLDNRDEYWKTRKDYAIYSTNCAIKQIGDYAHLKERDYHYYGGATSWEKRLGHINMENLKEDLTCTVSAKAYGSLLKRLGAPPAYHAEKQEQYLCAYIIPEKPGEQELPVANLRQFLSNELPFYMVPSYFEYLPKIPLTSNGKVDKKALPAPKKSRANLGETFVAPKNDLEKDIASVWKDVLGVDAVGTMDNFFDLGGNSLDIVMVGTKLKDNLKKEIPTVTMFSFPTINALANHLKKDENESPAKEVDRSQAVAAGKNMMKRSMLKLGGRK